MMMVDNGAGAAAVALAQEHEAIAALSSLVR